MSSRKYRFLPALTSFFLVIASAGIYAQDAQPLEIGWANSAAVQRILACKIEGASLDMSPAEAKAAVVDRGFETTTDGSTHYAATVWRDGLNRSFSLTEDGGYIKQISVSWYVGGMSATVDHETAINELKQCLGESAMECRTHPYPGCTWQDVAGDHYIVQYSYEALSAGQEVHRTDLNSTRNFGAPYGPTNLIPATTTSVAEPTDTVPAMSQTAAAAPAGAPSAGNESGAAANAPIAESAIRSPSKTVDLDYVVSQMARTAGRLQATAEQCTKKSEPGIRSDFIAASKVRFAEQIAVIEQAYDENYADRKASLADKRKQRCREKEHRRLSKENQFNLELLTSRDTG